MLWQGHRPWESDGLLTGEGGGGCRADSIKDESKFRKIYKCGSRRDWWDWLRAGEWSQIYSLGWGEGRRGWPWAVSQSLKAFPGEKEGGLCGSEAGEGAEVTSAWGREEILPENITESSGRGSTGGSDWWASSRGFRSQMGIGISWPRFCEFSSSHGTLRGWPWRGLHFIPTWGVRKGHGDSDGPELHL